MYYLAIDPGETTGWAAFDADGSIIDMGKIKGPDTFLDWLEEQNPTECILEIYRNRPGFVNEWSKGETQQLIGAIKRTLRKKGLTSKQIHEKEPRDLPIACKMAGIPYSKTTHLPDDQSAFAHGVHYLTVAGIRKHRLDKT